MSIFNDIINFVTGIVNTVVGSITKVISGLKNLISGLVQEASYYVVGGITLGVIVVTLVGGVIKQEIINFGNNVGQIPSQLLTYFGPEPARTGVGGHFVGDARFQVITPTLIRLEYAEDNQFEDDRTMLANNRALLPASQYQVFETATEFFINTGKMTLKYTKNSGKFNADNLKIVYFDATRIVDVKHNWRSPNYTPNPLDWGPLSYAKVVAKPEFNTPHPTQLGGWYRDLDNQHDAVPLWSGLLSRNGYAFIDDTKSAQVKGTNWIDERPFHNNIWKPGDLLNSLMGLDFFPFDGDYQDGYVFGYGNNYKQALADLRVLSGTTPLLPRKAFGVWFSKYAPITDAQYRNELFPAFRAYKVPLDVVAIDTDAKGPTAWNGWNWETKLFPNPTNTISYLKGQGADVILNIHPSISSGDPKLAATKTAVGTDTLGTGGASTYFFQWATGIINSSRKFDVNFKFTPLIFDFNRSKHVDAYMKLHDGFDATGVNGYWLDWCCDDSNVGGQINKGEFSSDNWLSQVYAHRAESKGSRWIPLSRIGASFQDQHNDRQGPWGAHRSAIHFTGDAIHSWPMLNFQARFAAAEGSIGQTYVSHDVGGFQLKPFPNFFGCPVGAGTPDCSDVSPELYVRFVQLNTFQPIFRLHAGASAGAKRLPWEFEGQFKEVSAEFMRLRGALVPYLYSAARVAHETGIPMVRAMYLDYPLYEQAYSYVHQYMLGDKILVAPIGTPANAATGLASKTVWFPPGDSWQDFFTGEVYSGGTVQVINVPLQRMPVYVKVGSIIPLAPYMDYSSQRPLDNLLLNIYPYGESSTTLYEDQGANLDYKVANKFTKTTFTTSQNGRQLNISAVPTLRFTGQVTSRAYKLKMANVGARAVSVSVDGVNIPFYSAPIPEVAPGPLGTAVQTVGWYRGVGGNLHVQTAKLATNVAHNIVVVEVDE